jgi:hypothetical protein
VIGQLQVTVDPGNNVFVDHSGSLTSINGQTFFDSQITNDIPIQTGAKDRVIILATGPSIAVDGHGQAGLNERRRQQEPPAGRLI